MIYKYSRNLITNENIILYFIFTCNAKMQKRTPLTKFYYLFLSIKSLPSIEPDEILPRITLLIFFSLSTRKKVLLTVTNNDVTSEVHAIEIRSLDSG